MNSTTKNDLFRLAAVLYADNNYEVSQKTIHKKIVESALLDNNNKESSTDEIIEWIERKYNFIFTEDEIDSIIVDGKAFVIQQKKSVKKIQLTSNRLSTLQNKLKNNTIEYFIDSFVNEKQEFKRFDAKGIIYKFLYEVFNVNIASFTKLLDYKKDIGEIKHLETGKFNDVEKGIINSFLQWENDGKNKAIFDISSYALEYCLITNSSKTKQIHLDNLRNKTFYLDTNVIFRALGINGDNRKARTITFLKKFNEANETLLLSRFTDLEFKATVKFYVDKIAKNYTPKISSKVFKHYVTQSEFFDYFHTWRANRRNDNLDLFEAHVFAEYESFRKEFDVKVDYSIPFDEKDEKISQEIEELSQGIYSFKNKEGYTNGFETSQWDAKNIYLLGKKRGTQNTSIFETKFFFISSDQSLRRWDYQRNHATPTVLLPSQWMSILLRYVTRTNDDFKSFVSFLNLPQTESQLSSENLQLVLTGISEITEDFEQQSAIIEIMIAKKFEGVITNGLTDEQIIQNSSKAAKSILEEEVKKVKAEHHSLERRLEDHIASSKLAIARLQEQKDAAITKNTEVNSHIIEATTIINAQHSENASLKEELRRKYIRKRIIRWRVPGVLSLLLTVFIIVSYILFFTFTTSWYNYSYALCKWIDSFPDNTTQRAILTTGLFSSGGLLIWSTTFSCNRLLNKEKKAKKIESILAIMPARYK